MSFFRNMKTRLHQRYLTPLQKYRFLFEELVKRDFKRKYKGTVLGMGWSVLSPLLQLLVMRLIFTQFFGRDTPHYTSYLFCGLLIYHYFRESTVSGMSSLTANAGIFGKVNVPKYLFILSKNVSSLITFGLTLCVFFVFVAIDHIAFSWRFLALVYPVVCLIAFNIGVGMILSALFIFFRDTSYLYDIFTLLLRYMCAIFYRIDSFPEKVQRLFLINPVYCYIKYFRVVVVDGGMPSAAYHLLCAGYAAAVLVIGAVIYKKYNTRFMYYI